MMLLTYNIMWADVKIVARTETSVLLDRYVKTV
jgi:hypothetical protein